jgi:hypothetical protein
MLSDLESRKSVAPALLTTLSFFVEVLICARHSAGPRDIVMNDANIGHSYRAYNLV